MAALNRFARSLALAIGAGALALAFGAGSAYADTCTHGQGWWGTHSKYGPSHYDPTWAKLGEDTSFYGTHMTYYRVIAHPVKGSTYFKVGQHFIAAALNLAAGAEASPESMAAFYETERLFRTYRPGHDFKKDREAREAFQKAFWALTKFNYGENFCGN